MKTKNFIIILCFCFGACKKSTTEATPGYTLDNTQFELVKFFLESAGVEPKRPNNTIPYNGIDCLKLLLGLGQEIGLMPWSFKPDGSIKEIGPPSVHMSYYTGYEKFFVPNVEGILEQYPGAIPFSHINDILAELGHEPIKVQVGKSKGVSITKIGEQVSKGVVFDIYCLAKEGNGDITCVPPMRHTKDVIEPAENTKKALMRYFPSLASLANDNDLLIIYGGSGGGSGASAVLVGIVSALIGELPKEFAVSAIHEIDGSLLDTGFNVEKAATCRNKNLPFVSADYILDWQCALNRFFNIGMPNGLGEIHFCYTVKELLELLFTKDALQKEYPKTRLNNKDLKDINESLLKGWETALKYFFNYGSTAAFAGLGYCYWDNKVFRAGIALYSLWQVYKNSRL